MSWLWTISVVLVLQYFAVNGDTYSPARIYECKVDHVKQQDYGAIRFQ